MTAPLNYSGRHTAVLLTVVLLAPLIANWDAYRGYFESDDLSTSNWARSVPLRDEILDLPSLKFPDSHERAPGYLYYGILLRTVGFQYPVWIGVMQTIGAINIALLWMLLRKLELSSLEAAVGCLFFGASRALFDAWWKPMFIFDVLCTTFVLAAIVAYFHKRWVISFCAAWLAFRTKEIGIVTPVVLLLWELTLGEKKWKRVLPFFFPAAIYGFNGLRYSRALNAGHTYQLRLTVHDTWQTTSFYFSKMLQLPYAGFIAVVALAATRDRRVWFGLGTMLCGIAIYLALPGRQFEVYLYLSMTGLAIAIAAASARRPFALTIAVLVWAGWQYSLTRSHAKTTLAEDKERHEYFSALQEAPAARTYAYADPPGSVHSWGVEAALHLRYGDSLRIYAIDDPAIPAEESIKLLHWNSRLRRLDVTDIVLSKHAYISEGSSPETWQFMEGWENGQYIYPNSPPRATFRLYRPAGDVGVSARACGLKGDQVRVFMDGLELPMLKFNQDGCETISAHPPGAGPGVQTIDFLVNPDGAHVQFVEFGFTVGR